MQLEQPSAFFLRGTPLPPGQPRTLVVLGAARGGTSMVAAMLQALGVPMGEQLGATVQDAALGRLAERHLAGGAPLDLAAVDRLVAQRNARHPVWGWKYPSHILEPIYRRMRAPHLVAVYRDPVAAGQREAVSQGLNPEASMARAQADLQRLTSWLRTVPWPCLYLSYERAMQDRAEVAQALAGFAGLAPANAALADALASARARSPEYLASTRARRVEGALDQVGAQVAGWLRRPHAPGQPVRFSLELDGQAVASGVADGFREDLVNAFGTDGRHAFSLAVPAAWRDGRSHRVVLRVEGEADVHIANNGRDWVLD